MQIFPVFACWGRKTASVAHISMLVKFTQTPLRTKSNKTQLSLSKCAWMRYVES